MNNQKNSVSFRYAALTMKYRWLILAFIIISTVLAALQISKVDIRNDPDTLLPQTNRYVSTNAYIEDKFGMGNIFVVGVEVTGEGSIYQPWFVNIVKEINDGLMELDHANKANFISIAAPKVKNMGVTDDGSLLFKRLIPNSGITTTNDALAKEQLVFMKEGIDNNPVLKPFILHEENPTTGEKCFNSEPECEAKATFVIADYSDDIKVSYVDWVRKAVAIADKYADDDRIKLSIAGEPYFLAWMMVQLIEHWYLFVASILIAFLILYIETKNWRGAVFPLFGVGVSIVWTLGLMGFTEFKLTTMMVLTPMLILAVGMGHAIQVTRRYMVSKRNGEDTSLAAFNALGFTIVPATLSIVTDAVGFATLASVDISFYKAYAYFGMFGMFTLLLTTSTLIPLLLTMFPDKKDSVSSNDGYAWEGSMGTGVANMLNGSGKILPIAFVILILALSIHYTKIDEGISKILNAKEEVTLHDVIQSDKYDLMPGVEKGIDYAQAAFKTHSQAIQDIFRLSDLMPGVISFNVPIRGKKPLLPECGDAYFDALYDAEDNGTPLPEKNCYDPEVDKPQGIMNKSEVMLAMEKMEDDLRKHPSIGFTASYAQYIKIANMLLITEPGKKPSLYDFKVPSTPYLLSKNANDDRNPTDIVSMYNGLLEMASSPGDLASMVQQNYNNGVIMGFINTMNPVETHSALKYIQDYIEKHKNDVGFKDVYFGFRNANSSGDTNELSVDGPVYVEPGVGGFLGAVEATREVTYDNWILNPLGTALAIFVIVTLIFRSLLMAGFLMVILMITLFAQYGLAGYFTSMEIWSGNLHFGNLVTLSIAMGLGVDYSIYMISRLKEEYAAHGDWFRAVKETVSTTGSSVLISVIVLLGSFIPLMATELGNTWGLSMYISEAIIIDVITSLTLLPLLIWWFKPKYVFNRE